MNLGKGNIFRSVCQEFCLQGGHAWQGACMAGGRACVAGGHAWQGACVVGGACMAGGVHGRGHVWQGACMAGGMHRRGCVAGGRAWWGGGAHVSRSPQISQCLCFITCYDIFLKKMCDGMMSMC